MPASWPSRRHSVAAAGTTPMRSRRSPARVHARPRAAPAAALRRESRISRPPCTRRSARTWGSAGLKQLCGKELSYNNLLDLDAATRLAGLLADPAAVVVKHTNPCGAAADATVAAALATAMAADPTSAFGSIVAVNRTFDRACAELLLAPGLFVEVIAAPAFAHGGGGDSHHAAHLEGERAAGRGAAGRSVGGHRGAGTSQRRRRDPGPAARRLLRRSRDLEGGRRRPRRPPALTQALDFAFTIVRRLTSNAIAVCQGTSLVGAGIGQTSRVDAVRIALEKAGDRARGGVLASDAFFPFPDSIELIARAGHRGDHPAGRLEARRRGDRGGRRGRHPDGVHGPPALPALTRRPPVGRSASRLRAVWRAARPEAGATWVCSGSTVQDMADVLEAIVAAEAGRGRGRAGARADGGARGPAGRRRRRYGTSSRRARGRGPSG